MPAWLASVRTSERWAAVITVTTTPSAPARAVRPERCRYALCSAGGSTWMTSSMSSTWMPRAAMSVATSTLTEPFANASRLRSRAFWARFPCRSTAGTPLEVSCRASFPGAVLGPGEEQAPTAAGCQFLDHRRLVPVIDLEHVVGHRAHLRRLRVDRVGHRVGRVAGDQHIDALVERGREQQPLTTGRGLVHDSAYRRQEPQVSHVVGLVENGDLDRAQIAEALIQQILQPSRAGGRARRVRTAGRRPGVLADSTEDDSGAQAEAGGEGLQGGVHLVGQFAGRDQDQGSRPLRLPRGAGFGEPLDKRQSEGEGLAAAGTTAAEHVAAAEGVRQGGLLDRERGFDPLLGEDPEQLRGEAPAKLRISVRGVDTVVSSGPAAAGWAVGVRPAWPDVEGRRRRCGRAEV